LGDGYNTFLQTHAIPAIKATAAKHWRMVMLHTVYRICLWILKLQC